MSKRWLGLIVFVCIWLTGCTAQQQWENEVLVETSDRLTSSDVNAEWTVEEQESDETIRQARVRLAVRTIDGAIVDPFDLTHEKLLHLIIVSQDLSYFHHVHPSYVGNGVFEIDNDFPQGGKYRLIADFKPMGGDSMTKMTWVELSGEPAAALPVAPDESLVDAADGVRAKLEVERLEARAGTTLTFELTDERTGEPIADLEPYLGAIGHVVVLSEDGSRYVHVHAEDDQGAGPTASFEATFPSEGIYKIWGQFQRGGRVFTVSYVVDV